MRPRQWAKMFLQKISYVIMRYLYIRAVDPENFVWIRIQLFFSMQIQMRIRIWIRSQ